MHFCLETKKKINNCFSLSIIYLLLLHYMNYLRKFVFKFKFSVGKMMGLTFSCHVIVPPADVVTALYRTFSRK